MKEIHVGSFIKNIRLDKNLKSSDIYQGIVSKGYYWKIENNVSIPSFKIFLQISDRLMISEKEIFNFLNSSNSTYINFGKRLKKYSITNDTNQMEKLTKQIEDEYIRTKLKKFQHMRNLAKLYLTELNNENVNNNNFDLITLKEYLGSCNNWTYYEVCLFSNILLFIDIDSILLFYNKIFTNFLNLKKYQENYHEEILLSINIITILLKNNRVKNAVTINSHLQKIIIEDQYIYTSILLRWINYIVEYHVNKDIKNLNDNLNNLWKTLQYLKMNDTLTLLKRWSKDLL